MARVMESKIYYAENQQLTEETQKLPGVNGRFELSRVRVTGRGQNYSKRMTKSRRNMSLVRIDAKVKLATV